MTHSLAPAIAAPGPSLAVQRVTAACGVEAWLVEEHSLPLLALEFAFDGGANRDPANAAIVATIATLARNLKLEVVAEGVETAEQLQGVRACGCGQAQGYLFSRAVPGEQVPALADQQWPVEAPT